MKLFKRFGLLAVALLAVFAANAPKVEAAASSNYLQNHVYVDFIQRAQAFTPVSALFVGLATTSGSAQACGTEVTGGAYARVSVTNGLSAWAGTQGAGTTTASSNSSGSSGTTSNNAAITFPAPTANWGSITTFCVWDASSGGNLYYYAALTTPKTVNSGDAAPSFAAGALTITIGELLRQHGFNVAANDPQFNIQIPFKKAG